MGARLGRYASNLSESAYRVFPPGREIPGSGADRRERDDRVGPNQCHPFGRLFGGDFEMAAGRATESLYRATRWPLLGASPADRYSTKSKGRSLETDLECATGERWQRA